MRRYETKMAPSDLLVELKCDMCGTASPLPHREWATEAFEVNRVTLSYRTGTHYPDCGHGDEISIDLCPACFVNRILPWLTSQGVASVSEQWEM